MKLQIPPVLNLLDSASMFIKNNQDNKALIIYNLKKLSESHITINDSFEQIM